MTMVAITIGVVGVIACFVGLEFWWKADSDLREERNRRLRLQEQLGFMPTIPSVLNDDDGGGRGGSPHLVVWVALTTPGIEILCAAPDSITSQTQMSRVEHLIERRHLAPGHSAITHRPGQIRLANGTRIIFRHANGRHDGVPFKGVWAELTWWYGPGPMPEELSVVTVSTSR